ncbi:methyltransferase domain-containing protein [Nocardia miyunensis]|uniref:methyltransferase domain-containing protein n=1 Tax=Nocardia miyunensis TaxID=282684 RepID=UPI000AC1C97D|nr:methyltransferase domain-containing protein [Nocardia miyunensis]
MTEFDRRLDDFDAYQHTPWGRLRYEQVLHNLTPHLPLRPVHVLDAGGGNGLDAIQLAAAGHHVTVMDSSAVSLEAARTSAASAGVGDRIEYLLGDIVNSAAALAGREFDVVLCHNVMQYLPEPGAATSALVGVLRAGGLLSVLAPNPRCDPLVSAVRSGDLAEALRLLDTPVRVSATYDIEYTPRAVDEVVADILAAGMNPPLRYGVRAVCDLISDNTAKHDPEFFDMLMRLENTMADRRPYMDIARFFHLIATKPDGAAGTLAEMQRRRVRLDMEDYETRVRTGPCFICGFLSGTPGFEHEIVHDDGEHVGFVNKYPALPGSVLVVPRRHVQDVVRELTRPQYLALQSAVHTVACAVAAVMNPERVYLFSMGSAHGNAHVHWLL